MKFSRKTFASCSFLFLIIISLVFFFSFQNMQKKRAADIVTKYFDLLNSRQIDAAQDLIYMKPEFSVALLLAKENYQAFPREYTIHIANVQRVNTMLVQVNGTLFDSLSRQTDDFYIFVMDQPETGSRVLILNAYNIPDKYMENVVMPPEDPNTIHASRYILTDAD